MGELLGGSSDFHAEPLALYHTEGAVIGEAWIGGTHDGVFVGIPATERRFGHPCAAIVEFEADRLRCEKVYFDFGAFFAPIGVLPGHETAAPEPARSAPDEAEVHAGGSISDAARATLDALHRADNNHDAAALAALYAEDAVIRIVAGEIGRAHV